MRRAIAALGLTFSLAGCATTEPLAYSSPSGRPDVIFYGQSQQQVVGKLSSLCMDHGHVLTEASPFQVVCKGELSAFQAAMIQMLMTNSYATTPELYYRFTLAQVGPDVRVQAYEWVESTMAFGQKRTTEITNPTHLNQLYTAMNMAAGPRPAAYEPLAQAEVAPTPAAAPVVQSAAPAVKPTPVSSSAAPAKPQCGMIPLPNGGVKYVTCR